MRLRSLFFVLLLSIFYSFSLQASCNSIDSDKPSIVFVHIGGELPNYLETAVKQARLFNSCNIIVVANESALSISSKSLEKYNTVCVTCESLSKTAEHQAFIVNSTLDKNSGNGLWSHSTERFFYLQDLMQQYTLQHVVHLENDNMLYTCITSLLPLFITAYPHLALTLDNDTRCIAGFLYSADCSSINHLTQFVAQRVRYGKMDMESLAEYVQCFGSQYVNQLPIIMRSYVQDHELISPFGHSAKNKFNYCQHDDEFASIFDGAAIGQYLGGIDPRNAPIGPGFINESCVFNPSLLSYSWKVDKQGRKVPFASYKGTEYRINNLHVHCKNLVKFLSVQEEDL